MANYNQSQREATGDIGFGILVEKAAADLPQTASDDLFTVIGGRVRAYIMGEVTEVIETQLNNTNLEFTPTAATGAANDLCGVLNITADVVGTQYVITGTAGDAMVDTGTTGWHLKRASIILDAGTVELHCAASNTGQTRWLLWYTPIDAGAYVEAA